MPLQRRLPKVGFNSRLARVTAEIRLSELGKVSTEVIDLAALQTARMINRRIKFVKVFASGSLDRAVKLRGLRVSRGARAAIEAAGGAIEP
jgi:large subunit ribosomal protein L15